MARDDRILGADEWLSSLRVVYHLQILDINGRKSILKESRSKAGFNVLLLYAQACLQLLTLQSDQDDVSLRWQVIGSFQQGLRDIQVSIDFFNVETLIPVCRRGVESSSKVMVCNE